jgi:hypothetical protein
MVSEMDRIVTTPQLNGHSVVEKRAELKHYFQQTAALYEALFDCISQPEAYVRPC